jgi:hypothetical protein
MRLLVLALVLLAALARAAEPPLLELKAVTASGSGLPVALLDRAEGTCGWQQFFHLELLDVNTGEATWTTRAWTTLVAQLPDGDLVVSNEAPASRAKFKVAVLRRKDGSVRLSCEAPVAAADLNVTWSFVKGRTNAYAGEAFVAEPPTGQGHALVKDPDLAPRGHTLELSTNGRTCALVERAGGSDQTLATPALERGVLVGDVRVQRSRGTLWGERAGKLLWKRRVSAGFEGDCNLP